MESCGHLIPNPHYDPLSPAHTWRQLIISGQQTSLCEPECMERQGQQCRMGQGVTVPYKSSKSIFWLTSAVRPLFQFYLKVIYSCVIIVIHRQHIAHDLIQTLYLNWKWKNLKDHKNRSMINSIYWFASWSLSVFRSLPNTRPKPG